MYEALCKEILTLLIEIISEIKEQENSNSSKAKELERLTTLKETIKAAFDANKLNDISLRQAMENANKKRKETAKALAAEEEKKIKLEKTSKKNEQTIAELEELEPKLEEERQAAEEKHAEVMQSLAQDTQSLQVVYSLKLVCLVYVAAQFNIFNLSYYFLG